MFTFENYLFSLFVVLMPVFVYFAYLYKRDFFKEHSVVFGLLCCVAIVLTMSYPLELNTGYIFDFRTVPWLLAFFYGGLRMGIVATLVVFLYRFYIGVDEGFFLVLFTYSFTGVMAALLLNRFKKALLIKQRLFLSFVLTLLNTVLITAGMFLGNNISNQIMPGFFTYFVLSHLVTILLVVFIIETLKEKEENKMALQQTEKIRLVGEMAASVAHEIRNPLTVVKGFLQMFKSEENLTENQRNKVELMDTELMRAEQIINDYLSLAKPEKKEFEQIDIREVLARTVNVIEPYATLNSAVIENEMGKPCFVYANRQDVGQIFLNVIKNGIESISQNGKVTIWTEQNGDESAIHIRDNGRGMTEEEINRLGTPFYTTKDQGTGLGTMVCYKLVDELNGRVKVKSEKGAGTLVSIYLPASASSNNKTS